MTHRPLTRRSFLGSLAVLPLTRQSLPQAQQSLTPAQQSTDSLAGRGATGTLHNPSVVGRPRTPTDYRENDPEIQRIEQQLACTCGCTLDVFTCRTTDFTCTYSPALHGEVLALYDRGKTAREILDAFVAKYGEQALMAPKPQGFNLWGYLLPGVAVGGAAILLAAVLRRRQTVAAGAGPVSVAEVDASPEELERLERALEQVEN